MSRNVRTRIDRYISARQGRLLAIIALILTFVACLAHLLIGGDPVVVLVAGLTFALSICPIALCGFLNLGAVLMALVGFQYVGFPIFAKLAMGQPLDSNLTDPRGAFLVVLLGMVGYLTAFACASIFPVGRPILKRAKTERDLGRISIFAGMVGAVASAAIFAHAGHSHKGISVANFFLSFFYLALISALARNAPHSRRQTRDWRVWVLVAALFAIGVVTNQRGVLPNLFLCLVVVKTAFDAEINWKLVAAATGALALGVVLITPIFLRVRAFRANLTWRQLIAETWHATSDWRETFSLYHDRSRIVGESQGWYLRYYGAPDNILERLSLINHVDVLKTGSDVNARYGGRDLRIALEVAIPRALAPNKPRGFSQGDWLYQTMGVQSGMGGYSTAPLIGEGYACFGWLGAFCYPFIMGFALLLLIRKISGFDLCGNIWAIFVLVLLQGPFVEGDSATYVVYFLRTLPQDLVLMWLMMRLSAIRFIGPSSVGRRLSFDRRFSSGRS